MDGNPKGGFAGRKRHKPGLALNNNTAGVCEREDANRTREAGHLDEIQGVVANRLNIFRGGAVGFIDWLGLSRVNNFIDAILSVELILKINSMEKSSIIKHSK